MKKHIAYIIILFFIWSQSIYATWILKPNLLQQMKYQEKVLAQNKIQEKKYANMMRLAEIRKKKEIALWTKLIQRKNTGTPKTQVNNSTSVVSSPKILSSIQNESQIIQNIPTSTIEWVDMTKVYSSWFSWYNSYRTSLWLSSYNHNTTLDSTSSDWNKVFANGKWLNHHTRNTGDGYYNFSKIDAWFRERWVNPTPISWAKHTENVWYGYYSCNQGDCSDELIESIRSTFDFFMSEKGKSYDAHYRSIINPYFTQMWLDIIVVPSEKRYYITIHYATSF